MLINRKLSKAEAINPSSVIILPQLTARGRRGARVLFARVFCICNNRIDLLSRQLHPNLLLLQPLHPKYLNLNLSENSKAKEFVFTTQTRKKWTANLNSTSANSALPIAMNWTNSCKVKLKSHLSNKVRGLYLHHPFACLSAVLASPFILFSLDAHAIANVIFLF